MVKASGHVAITVEWVFVFLSLCFVLTRVHVRLSYHQKRLNVSDMLVIIGWLFALAAISCDTTTYRAGGMSPGDLVTTDDKMVVLLKIAYADDMFNDVGFYFSKFSLLALYYDIISVIFTKLRISLHIVTAYVVVACLVTWILDTFWCIPVSNNWSLDFNVCHIFCEEVISNINWSLNISSDLAIFILPFFMLRHLRLSRQQNFGLMVTFFLGAITMLCSTARFVVLHLSILTDYAPIYILYSMEINVSLIVVSIPHLRPLVRGRSRLNTGNGDSEEGDSNFKMEPS